MNQIKNFSNKFIKGLIKLLLRIFIAFVLLFFILSTLLQLPSVQKLIVNTATDYCSRLLNHSIHIEGIDLNWYDEIVLTGVSIKDTHKHQMILINELVANIEISSASANKVNIEKVILRNGRVEVIKYINGDINITNFIHTIQDLTAPKTPRIGPPVPFIINDVFLENMFFSYNDQRKPKLTGMFDHNHFSCDSIYTDVERFKISADTVQFMVAEFSTIETDIQLRVHQLTTMFTLTKRMIEFDELYASVGNSKIKNYIQFKYKNIDELSDFNDKIIMHIKLDRSYINYKDLAWFAPELKQFDEEIAVSGKFDGKVSNFSGKNIVLHFGKGSFFKGNVRFNGLPDFQETFIEANFKKSSIHTDDLKQYMSESTQKVLSKFGNIYGDGNFTGFPTDFVAYGSFTTDLGKLTTDIKLNLGNDGELPHYQGKLKTNNFQLGKILNTSMIGKIDMSGEINGKGFYLDDADFNLKANISRCEVNQYPYKNIITDAKFSKAFFDGRLSVADTNLSMLVNGTLDFRNNQNTVKINADCWKANLKPLRLSPKEAHLKTKIALDFIGLDIDEIIGNAALSNTYIVYEGNKEIFIDTLTAFNKTIDGTRDFTIESDIMTVTASGKYTFTQASKDITMLYEEYMMGLNNNTEEINKYYQNKKPHVHDKYEVEFDAKLKDINAILDIYYPHLYVSENTRVNGNFISGYTSILNLNSYIDTIFYEGMELQNTMVDISVSKIADSAQVLSMMYINSSNQNYRDKIKTEHLYFEGIWNEDKINFTTMLKQTGSGNRMKLKGTYNLLENEERITLKDSYFALLKNNWSISDNSKISFHDNDIIFENFDISNYEQIISLNGLLSTKEEKKAYLEFKNFELESINELISNAKITGILDGKVVLKDIFDNIIVDGDLTLKDLRIENFLVGNVIGKAVWNYGTQKLDTDVNVIREQKNIIDLKGEITYDSIFKEEKLNLSAVLNEANLDILNPIFEGVLSDLSGNVSGGFKVGGTIDQILLKGTAKIQHGKFKVPYLGTEYHFNDYIHFDPNNIGFKKLQLKDINNNIAIIDGGIYHDGFTHFGLDIETELENFQILNTEEKDNPDYYGTAFATGDMEVLGAFSDLKIRSTLTSNKDTKIYIPLNSYEGVEKQEYISFVKPGNSNKQDEPHEDKVDLSGIDMVFNLDLTPDAYIEIIFDKKAGDIIRGNGKGQLELKIDTRGDFNMYGSYSIMKGAYNFTLAGLINKEFIIEPNSTISWSGDPYAGTLDINATYPLYVSLAPIITDSLKAAEPSSKRKNPVNVLMGLEGNLMSPEIDLDIEILKKYSGDISSFVTEFENKLKSDQNELNRQVFSLLVLKKLSSPNSFSGVSGTENNLSELLSNQLSNWLSQVDENLQIDIDLSTLDRDALNTFQLRFSYTLLDGRLRISRDGSFKNVQNNQQANLSNVAGEWTVEYLISPDGKFRLKLFNKINQNNLISTFSNNTNTSAGFSIMHTQGFNKLSDLFGKKKRDFSYINDINEEGNSDENESENKPPIDIINDSDKKEEEDSTNVSKQ